MRVLFMGTPEISAMCLRRLVADGHNVVGVVTGEDKPRGRKMIMTPTDTRVAAEELGIPTHTPRTLKDDAFKSYLQSVSPDIIVVVAYGKILPKNVIDYPKYGCINIHGSLLPEYRGAAPMQRAIIDGKDKTGITIMYMAEGLDTGDMLLWRELPIKENDNFEDIHDGLGALGAEMIVEIIPMLRDGTAVRTPQDDALSTYARKILIIQNKKTSEY